MSTIRGVKDRRFKFTQTLNTMHDDPNISLKAKGLIGYCMSKPENWEFHVKQMASVLKEGEDSIYSGINECIKHGYAYRYQPRGKDGRVLRVVFTISDSKDEISERLKELKKEEEFKESLPHRGFPDPVNPDAVNPDPVFPGENTSAIYNNTDISNTKKQQQHHAAVFSEKSNEKKMTCLQKNSEPAIFECMKEIDIPQVDKTEITKRYDENTVKNAIAWATHASNPPTKCIAASIKFACKNGLSAKEYEQKKTPPKVLDCSPYNRAYFREISKISHKNGFRLHSYITESNEYIQTDNTKIYFKDAGFLEQVANFIRKKSIVCQDIFNAITQCKNDLIQQQT